MIIRWQLATGGIVPIKWYKLDVPEDATEDQIEEIVRNFVSDNVGWFWLREDDEAWKD